jgi:hypothetical protein
MVLEGVVGSGRFDLAGVPQARREAKTLSYLESAVLSRPQSYDEACQRW